MSWVEPWLPGIKSWHCHLLYTLKCQLEHYILIVILLEEIHAHYCKDKVWFTRKEVKTGSPITNLCY